MVTTAMRHAPSGARPVSPVGASLGCATRGRVAAWRPGPLHPPSTSGMPDRDRGADPAVGRGTRSQPRGGCERILGPAGGAGQTRRRPARHRGPARLPGDVSTAPATLGRHQLRRTPAGRPRCGRRRFGHARSSSPGGPPGTETATTGTTASPPAARHSPARAAAGPAVGIVRGPAGRGAGPAAHRSLGDRPLDGQRRLEGRCRRGEAATGARSGRPPLPRPRASVRPWSSGCGSRRLPREPCRLPGARDRDVRRTGGRSGRRGRRPRTRGAHQPGAHDRDRGRRHPRRGRPADRRRLRSGGLPRALQTAVRPLGRAARAGDTDPLRGPVGVAGSASADPASPAHRASARGRADRRPQDVSSRWPPSA